MIVSMMQGDSYNLKVTILNKDKTPVTPDDVRDVEITVGSLSKTYANNEVTYNEGIEQWLFPLTQEETFKFAPARVKAQVRIVMKSGIVEGVPLGTVNVLESISKEVL